jgi:hypothetical protein
VPKIAEAGDRQSVRKSGSETSGAQALIEAEHPGSV